MNDKLRRIDPLIRRAEERKQSVAREFGARHRHLQSQEQRLQDLQRFSDEYASWPQGATLAPAQLANREAFRARLDDAMATQSRHVEQCRSLVEIERLRLGVVSRERKVVENLAQRYRDELAELERRRDQRTLDEHALRGHRQRHLAAEDDA